MKILFTAQSFAPATHGMAEITGRLSRWLSAQGHEVTIATHPHPDRKARVGGGLVIEEFEISGNLVAGYQGKDIIKYQQFLLESNFDIVVNFLSQIAFTDLTLPLLKHIPGKKVLVPTCFLMYGQPQWDDYYTRLLDYMGSYDACVYHSSVTQDYLLARDTGLTNSFIIPNGASSEEFLATSNVDLRAKLNIPTGDLLVLHVGQFTGYKGHIEAADIFCRSNIRNATLLLVSHKFASESFQKGFRNWIRMIRWMLRYLKSSSADTLPSQVTGEIRGLTGLKLLYALRNRFHQRRLLYKTLIREETIAAYQEADLFLFPSRLECAPIVITECLASGTAFLAADVGNISEMVATSQAGELLPTRKLVEQLGSTVEIKPSIEQFNSLANDRDQLKAMGAKGLQAWEDMLSWEQIAAEYESLFKKLL